jgi:hypothetical protein
MARRYAELYEKILDQRVSDGVSKEMPRVRQERAVPGK